MVVFGAQEGKMQKKRAASFVLPVFFWQGLLCVCLSVCLCTESRLL